MRRPVRVIAGKGAWLSIQPFEPGAIKWREEDLKAMLGWAPDTRIKEHPVKVTDYPSAARLFKDSIGAVDAVLFVTPEYTRSLSGALKNAVDWASRPYGQNAFPRKPSAIIGTSPGKIGTAVAEQHLRSILCFCNSPLMNSIAAYVQSSRASSPTTTVRRASTPCCPGASNDA